MTVDILTCLNTVIIIYYNNKYCTEITKIIITPELTRRMIINTNLIRSVYRLITTGKLYIVHPLILSKNRFIDLF